MDGVVDPVARRRLRRPGLGSPRLIPQGDEQRRDVLAVPAVAGGERRTGTAGGKPARAELKRHFVRLRIGAAHVPASPRLLDDDVLDGVTAYVIVTAQVRARPEQTPKSAVVKRGESFGER
jgi:hypothetical protein